MGMGGCWMLFRLLPYSAISGRPRLPFHLPSGTIGGTRYGIFSVQGLKETLVGAINTELAEPIDTKGICLTLALGSAASRPRNPADLLSTLVYASCTHGVH